MRSILDDFFLLSPLRERNTTAGQISNNFSRRIWFPTSLQSDEDVTWITVGSVIVLLFGAAIWNIKSWLFIDRQRPQVFCYAQKSQWEMEVRFKDHVVSGEGGKLSINSIPLPEST